MGPKLGRVICCPSVVAPLMCASFFSHLPWYLLFLLLRRLRLRVAKLWWTMLLPACKTLRVAALTLEGGAFPKQQIFMAVIHSIVAAPGATPPIDEHRILQPRVPTMCTSGGQPTLTAPAAFPSESFTLPVARLRTSTNVAVVEHGCCTVATT